jgi:ribosomal protein S18 acetylase RimI-like enzyme
MGLFFGKERQAVPMLKKLILLDHNHFSHNHILCARHNGEIVGILSGFGGEMNRVVERECAQEYFKSLGLLGALRAGFVALFMQWLFKKTVSDDEFYVNNLCVAPGNRSLGIGAALLGEIFKNYDKVSLGVNVNNHRGMKFYVRNGFKIESGYKINIFGKPIGVYNMIWSRKDSLRGSG